MAKPKKLKGNKQVPEKAASPIQAALKAAGKNAKNLKSLKIKMKFSGGKE